MDSKKGLLAAYLATYKKPLLKALLLGIATVVCATILMFASGYLITRTAQAGVFLLMVMTPIACVQLFGIGKPFAHYFERLSSHDWVFRVTSDIRKRLFDTLEAQSSAIEAAGSIGEIAGLLARDIGHLQNLYLRVVFPTTIAFAFYILLALVLGFFSPGFMIAMAILLGIVIFALPMITLLTLRDRISNDSMVTFALYDDLADNVLGSIDWVLSGHAHEFSASISESLSRLRELRASIRGSKRVLNLATFAILAGCVWLTILWSSGALGGSDAESVSLASAFIFGSFTIIEVFSPLNEAASGLDPQLDAVYRLDNLLFGYDKPEAHGQVAQATNLDRAVDRTGVALSFDHVSFAYPDNPRKILSDVSFDIRTGERVIVLGRSGAGKSTFAALARGDLSPSEGSILAFGKSPASYGSAISSIISYVEQAPYVFNRSIRDNLRLADPGATDGEIVRVLQRVGLSKLVDGRIAHIDDTLEEAGKNLSGGERHRIALARALLTESPLLVFDEPTVGLDPATENALFETLFDCSEDRTLVVISHHLSHVLDFDRVLFIEDGRVALNGNPIELSAREDWFENLLESDR